MEKKAKIYVAITALWIAVIFSFSLQPGDISSKTSAEVGKWIVEVALPQLAEEIENISADRIENMHYLLRKCAHFSEYFILGVLVEKSIQQIRICRKTWLGLPICVLVAAIDETIQLFVSGRSGRAADVVLDSVGALCGVVFLLLMGKVFKRMKKSRTDSCV